MLFASAIAPGSFSRAGADTPAVSLWRVTFTSAILPPEKVTATAISPPRPVPTPSKVPSLTAAPAERLIAAATAAATAVKRNFALMI